MDKRTWVEIFEAAGIDAEKRHAWHVAFERKTPEGHRDFLAWLGLAESEIEAVRRDARR